MTIIAYRDGIMAADSLIRNERVLGESKKIDEVVIHGEKCLVATAGNVDKCELFRNWVINGMVDTPKLDEINEKDNFEAFIIGERGENQFVSYETTCIPCSIEAPFYAIGSGSSIAIGAMERGATAKEAVEAAIKWSPDCGGRIYVLGFDTSLKDILYAQLGRKSMKKFKKKPIVIEAIQFDGSGDMPDVELHMIDSDAEWICKQCGKTASKHGNVKTLEGFHIACPGDWIIRGIKGEHYPCKPDIFSATYDPI